MKIPRGINLNHVLFDTCKDPDCELHNLSVALEEQVVGETDIAFYLAAMQVLKDFYCEGTDARLSDEARFDAAIQHFRHMVIKATA
jgi:hypothetical protein